MRATPLRVLLSRIAGEYSARASIFDIPERLFKGIFELEDESPGLEVMGGRASLPLGPAAGPHSQIAPNLVAAYLSGSRVFELKTVQANDSLEIAKPCILALDEGHNTEWSTELSLDVAREEYLRGYLALSVLAAIWSPKPRDFFFNMSVGYTLDGIKSPKVDAFIEGMRAPAGGDFWESSLREAAAFVDGPAFKMAFGSEAAAKALSALNSLPSSPVHSVTLSTMHGCPPAEIGRIGRYLIEEKGFDAYVKLNPTLLGYDEVRRILDATGWTEIEISRGGFERDLQWEEALALVRSLGGAAEAAGRRFGLKLSNTLANANDLSFLPGPERYMSGRALFPITATLAARLAAALPGFPRRFSYCGGVSALNAAELVSSGCGPLTVATDILKPGGYLRLEPMARAVVGALRSSKYSEGEGRPNPEALAHMAARALERPEYRREWKTGRASIARSLPLFDCFAAPCVEACPVGQKVPEYIRRAAAGDLRGAFVTVMEDNPLPTITGNLCDHVCQTACSRNDYEGPVEIRAVKLACAAAMRRQAARHGTEAPPRAAAGADLGRRVAVLGAGPAGLACAHHLALAGLPVTVFDKAARPGGVPANVIPRFRIPRADLAADIGRIEALGVEFRMGVEILSLETLRARGYTDFFVASGAPAARELRLEGGGVRIVNALSFLEAASLFETGHGSSPSAGARRIVVAGGGNTAMDAVRAACRLPGVERVTLSYRRTRAEMPADREELGNAVCEAWALLGGSEGDASAPFAVKEEAVVAALSAPERAAPGRLSLRRMRLGDRDPSGRRAPVPTAETFDLDCDLLVAAVGETPDLSLLEALGVELGTDGRPVHDAATQASGPGRLYVGGDAARGPASIIAAEADGRRAAYAIMRSAGLEPPAPAYAPPPPDPGRLASRGELRSPLRPGESGFLEREAERCLACDSACLRCVEVCPNRANTAVPAVPGAGSQAFQILHIDRLCNECGNCGLFCPFEGEPFRGKATLFDDEAAMAASPNAGFAVLASGGSTEDRADGVLVRRTYEGPVERLSLGELGTGGPMAALALAVLRDHPYLLGGER